MANSTYLMDALRVQLPGALDAAITIELFGAVDELCRVGEAWQSTIEITLQTHVSVYPIPIPASTEIVQIYSIEHDSLDVSDTIFDPDVNAISFTDLPEAGDIDQPLFVDVSLVPTRDAAIDNYLPSTMWNAYHQALLHGTLGRMMMQAAKTYSSPTLAVYHLKRFRNLMAHTRASLGTAGAYGGQNWSYPTWTR